MLFEYWRFTFAEYNFESRKRCVYDSKEEYVIEAIKIAKNAVLNSGLLLSQATKTIQFYYNTV